MSDDLPSVTAGDVDELDDPFLLDVREPDEYDAGHAPGVVLHPLGELPAVWSELPTDRTVLCICRIGRPLGARDASSSGARASTR